VLSTRVYTLEKCLKEVDLGSVDVRLDWIAVTAQRWREKREDRFVIDGLLKAKSMTEREPTTSKRRRSNSPFPIPCPSLQDLQLHQPMNRMEGRDGEDEVSPK
jgi:hypothetical protein